MLSKFMETVGPKIGTTALKVKGVSPELYLAGGIVLGVAAIVTVARAHRKSKDVYDEISLDLEDVEMEIERLDEEFEVYSENPHPEFEGSKEPVSHKQALSMRAPVYQEAILQTIKLYGPGVVLGVGSIALILASHGVMKGRTKALASAVVLLESGFATYRNRVVEEYGVEADERMYHGADVRRVTTLENSAGGKKAKKKRANKNYIPEVVSPLVYSRVFDETNFNYSKDPGLNEYVLRAKQQHAHDKFNIEGHIMLNDVYKSLGFEPTPEGQVVGWSKNTKTPHDDFVSFGLDDDINQREGDNRWVLNFNVHGPVWELIGLRDFGQN